jgi:hypothetical protein
MKYIWIKLLKNYGSFKAGDIVRYGDSKGRPIIAKGFGEEVPEQKAVNDTITEPVRVAPVVETAVIDVHTEPTEQAISETIKRGRPRGNKWIG